MRFILAQLWFGWWVGHQTLMIGLLTIDTFDTETSFLEIGWYQGDFCFDIFWIRGIKRYLEDV